MTLGLCILCNYKCLSGMMNQSFLRFIVCGGLHEPLGYFQNKICACETLNLRIILSVRQWDRRNRSGQSEFSSAGPLSRLKPDRHPELSLACPCLAGTQAWPTLLPPEYKLEAGMESRGKIQTQVLPYVVWHPCSQFTCNAKCSHPTS